MSAGVKPASSFKMESPMLLPHGATIAVLDGEKMRLFKNEGNEAHAKLTPLPEPVISGDNKGSGTRHQSSDANPDRKTLEEDSFAAAAVDWLNKGALSGKIDNLAIIAAPRTLGEMRKHYHKSLQGKLLGELAKDLTGQAGAEIEAVLAKA